MGRYLANGVLSRFEVKKRKAWYSDSNFNLKAEMKNVLNDISEIIDPNLYDLIVEDEDYYEFSLKPNVFNENIHELINEISPLTYPNVNGFSNFEDIVKEKEIDLNGEKFKIELPYICKVNEKGEYYIELNGEEFQGEDYPFYAFYWLIDNRELVKNIEIRASVILIWTDNDKYDGEDETTMLKIINNMKTKYYNSLLSKTLVYYVAG